MILLRARPDEEPRPTEAMRVRQLRVVIDPVLRAVRGVELLGEVGPVGFGFHVVPSVTRPTPPDAFLRAATIAVSTAFAAGSVTLESAPVMFGFAGAVPLNPTPVLLPLKKSEPDW